MSCNIEADKMQAGKNRYFFVESLVFALVIFSALGIYSHDVEDLSLIHI